MQATIFHDFLMSVENIFFFKINVFKKFFQEYNLSVKQWTQNRSDVLLGLIRLEKRISEKNVQN